MARLTLPAAGARVLREERGERVLPRGPPARSLLYLHGGAYVSGAARTHRAITTQLAVRCDAEVLALDYRLAPEHPFPAALEDAVAAYRVLRASAPQRPLCIAGDSAGGGLALATALRLRELGESLPQCLVLFSPWVNLEIAHLPAAAPAGEAMLDPAWIRASAAAYLAGQPAAHPLASPLFADLRGLPPLLVQVGTDELLLPQVQQLAARAEAAGVSVRLEVYEGLWHVFQLHAGMLRASGEALQAVAEFVRAAQR
nr:MULTISPECIES: alpha/beta hydrolase [Myxococcaceae]